MTDILMPTLSPTMEEAALTRWFVAPGDRVNAGDVIAEIETDKASMEVEAAESGVIAALLVEAGAQGVKVNAPIARMGDAVSPVAEPPTLSPAARRIVAERQLDASEIVGSGRDGRVTKGDALAAARQASTPVAAPAEAAVSEAAAASASPLARRMAAAGGLDLSSIKGSGPEGRVLKADLDAALGRRPAPAAPPPPQGAPSPTTPTPVPSLAAMGVASGSYDLAPLDGMRRTIAKRMTESFRDTPHFPLSMDLEVDALLAARARINAALAAEGVKVSLNDMIIKAAAQALRLVPEANASYTPEGIALHHHADISVAVAVEGGLITPIVRAAESKGVGQIAREMADLAERARTKRLRPEEFQGGTFSISNLGMFGVKSFSSILNAPQGAILSVGAGEPRPVVRAGELAVATVCTMTLTCDHRAMDGAVGARFLAAFSRLVREPLLF